ncbi:hypothetical protein HC256_009738 [Beauveria bassiana]|nr:hypothetical protein HC256_009738 [Beauveria bassiana]
MDKFTLNFRRQIGVKKGLGDIVTGGITQVTLPDDQSRRTWAAASRGKGVQAGLLRPAAPTSMQRRLTKALEDMEGGFDMGQGQRHQEHVVSSTVGCILQRCFIRAKMDNIVPENASHRLVIDSYAEPPLES